MQREIILEKHGYIMKYSDLARTLLLDIIHHLILNYFLLANFMILVATHSMSVVMILPVKSPSTSPTHILAVVVVVFEAVSLQIVRPYKLDTTARLRALVWLATHVVPQVCL